MLAVLTNWTVSFIAYTRTTGLCSIKARTSTINNGKLLRKLLQNINVILRTSRDNRSSEESD
jgi:hypothetical protein